MWNRGIGPALFFLFLLAAAAATAGDEEGCLLCHRHPMRRGSGGEGFELRVADPQGRSHDTLYCSDCHPGARSIPHAARPDQARCIGECHTNSRTASETHRRASFGGLTEVHRGAATAASPCLLCHSAADAAGDRKAIAYRCGACHLRESDSVMSGVHGRLMGRDGDGMCAACHPAHPAGEPSATGKGKVTCEGKECHSRLTPGMKRLGGHDVKGIPGGSGGRLAGPAVFLVIACMGWLSGRFLGGRARKEGSRE